MLFFSDSTASFPAFFPSCLSPLVIEEVFIICCECQVWATLGENGHSQATPALLQLTFPREADRKDSVLEENPIQLLRL